jgi:plasmid stabilization system protein ParE
VADRIVIVHPLAAREYRSAFRWYRKRSTNAAHRFLSAVDQTMQRIETAAEQGTVFRVPCA